MSHTPGPWTLTTRKDGTHHIGNDRIGHTVLDEQAEYYRMDDADARLIAAAPDLLEALEGVLPFAASLEASMAAEAASPDGGQPADDYLQKLSAARAAIAKAKS